MKKMIVPTTIITSVMLLTNSAVAQMVQSVYLEGRTDSTGRFAINHQYEAEPSNCESTRIVGATVAIRNSGNGQWYIVHDRNDAKQAINFGNRVITGYFGTNEFKSQPVRVVLFLSHQIC
ncbi:hypothetical protein [Nostoc sp. CCY0012]|uniref:hypothetical protein n=1 Tax=Nostoc sp. CCY0012 TaxID=1056123 RepID=UPI0039C6E7D0